MNNAFNGIYSIPYNPYMSSYSQLYQMQQAQAQQPQPQPQQNTSITWVNGIEGAKGYMLPPNSSALLMDSDSTRFYIKTTDSAGMGSIKAYRFEEISDNATGDDSSEYVKKSDIGKYIEEYFNSVGGIENGKSDKAVGK